MLEEGKKTPISGKAPLFWILMLVSFGTTFGQSKNQLESELSFEALTIDLDTININGPAIEFDFQFTNTGSVPTQILSVKGSVTYHYCSFPRQIIPPGGTGLVNVEVDPRYLKGEFQKILVLKHSNHLAPLILTYQGLGIPETSSSQ